MTGLPIDVLVEALEASTGFPVPTAREFAERIVEQLDAGGFEITRKHAPYPEQPIGVHGSDGSLAYADDPMPTNVQPLGTGSHG